MNENGHNGPFQDKKLVIQSIGAKRMQNKLFTTVFLICLSLMIAVNLYSYSIAVDPLCSFPAEFGLPVTAGTYGGFVSVTTLNYFGVFINTLFAVTVSRIAGYATNKIYQSRYKPL